MTDAGKYIEKGSLFLSCGANLVAKVRRQRGANDFRDTFLEVTEASPHCSWEAQRGLMKSCAGSGMFVLSPPLVFPELQRSTSLQQ